MTGIFGDVSALIQSHPWLAVVAVFLGGVATASNPCVLAMVPLAMAMVAGTEKTRGFKTNFVFTLFFMLGLSITFTALGLISALLGRMFGDVGSFWKYVVAAVCLVMGLQLLGLFKLEFRSPRFSAIRKQGNLGAFLLGLLFGVVSTPCAVPILAVILAFVAQKGDIAYGGLLLFVYALGHSLLVLIAGTSMSAAKTVIASRGWNKANGILQKIAGAVIILAGLSFVLRTP
jgi:cytochrome c-type biogenesis protein